MISGLYAVGVLANEKQSQDVCHAVYLYSATSQEEAIGKAYLELKSSFPLAEIVSINAKRYEIHEFFENKQCK